MGGCTSPLDHIESAVADMQNTVVGLERDLTADLQSYVNSGCGSYTGVNSDCALDWFDSQVAAIRQYIEYRQDFCERQQACLGDERNAVAERQSWRRAPAGLLVQFNDEDDRVTDQLREQGPGLRLSMLEANHSAL